MFEQKKQNYLFIDYARVAACISVVIIHTISSNVASMTKVPFFDWWIDSIIDSVLVCAVPLFIMISGALNLGREESIRTFYIKRLLSVVVPSIFWITFYVLLFSNIRGISYSFLTTVSQIIFDQPFENLYFLFIIIELYLITPLINKFIKGNQKKIELYYALIFLIIGILWRYQQFVGTMFIPYLGYYILGHYLRDVTISKPQKQLLKISFLLNVAVIALGTYLFASHIIYNFNDDFFFYRHTNLFVVFLTLTAYLLFKSNERFFITQKKLTKLINEISPFTLGIYIIHWPMRVLLFYLLFQTNEIIYPIPLWSQPLVFLFLFSFSLLITKILSRIPVIKYIV